MGLQVTLELATAEAVPSAVVPGVVEGECKRT